MADQVDIEGMQDSKPKEAPVSDPLTGKEKAGVYLTWGIIGVLVVFLFVILLIFFWGEYRYLSAFTAIDSIGSDKLNNIEEMTKALTESQKSFRAFWFDTLQLILLNVLFPTLTALLGYVFGTSRNTNS